MLKKILIAVAALIAVLVAIVALQPADYRVARTATVAAPPAAVFAQVDDFHRWDAWSPWAKLDPAATTSFAGTASGTGASFTWSGNEKIGEGTMTITESHPSDLIRIRLDFRKPFADTSTAEFAFAPAGDGTAVTWSMSGRKNFIAKAMCLFMDMDKMLGGQFEQGLAQLKAAAERNRN